MAQRFFGFVRSVSLSVPAEPAPAEWRPNTDIYRTPHGWLVKFDLAGVRPEDVELTRQGNRLAVRGIRRDWCLEGECHCYQLEIAYSRFERQIALPANLDRATIQAEHRDGMLVVRVHDEDLSL
jgi:HSP20 family protein